ncbi:helix-turn-helix domain-containing protein [Glycomyces artemisiae]|uniref:helix-turn-helix domain-containing protein n=1 Tax=Glycomyces artemisiae TaxID=1076443 RepID=UPI001C62C475|nr:helix-turn-helix domain-containing protein [Glycomyces artemisiae]
MTDRDFSSFVRDVRKRAHVSFRELSDSAGVSNPYLQGERGVRRPSGAVLRQLALALRMTTPIMYLRASVGSGEDGGSATPLAIATDRELTARQKQTLTEMYEAFCDQNERTAK